MKKSIALLLIVVLLLCFAGCKSNTVTYRGQVYDADALSAETLEWLEWFNSLSEEEQLAISYVPNEFLEPLDGEVQDAPAQG